MILGIIWGELKTRTKPKSCPFFGVVNAQLDHYVPVAVNATVPNTINTNNLTSITQHDTVRSEYYRMLEEIEQESRKLYREELE